MGIPNNKGDAIMQWTTTGYFLAFISIAIIAAMWYWYYTNFVMGHPKEKDGKIDLNNNDEEGYVEEDETLKVQQPDHPKWP